jgi:hypothetical protein
MQGKEEAKKGNRLERAADARKALDLTVPVTLLARADEVIE